MNVAFATFAARPHTLQELTSNRTSRIGSFVPGPAVILRCDGSGC